MGRVVRVVVIILAILSCVGIAAFVVDGWLFQTPSVTTQVSAYPKLLKDWSPTGLVDHFPRRLPSNATDVSLAAFPGFLQGAAFIQLRMKLPAREVEAIMTKTRAAAVRRCPDQCRTPIESPEFWSVPPLVAGSEPEGRFPSDFVVYALETKGDWDHPVGKGIAISRARSEVVYWAEY